MAISVIPILSAELAADAPDGRGFISVTDNVTFSEIVAAHLAVSR